MKYQDPILPGTPIKTSNTKYPLCGRFLSWLVTPGSTYDFLYEVNGSYCVGAGAVWMIDAPEPFQVGKRYQSQIGGTNVHEVASIGHGYALTWVHPKNPREAPFPGSIKLTTRDTWTEV